MNARSAARPSMFACRKATVVRMSRTVRSHNRCSKFDRANISSTDSCRNQFRRCAGQFAGAPLTNSWLISTWTSEMSWNLSSVSPSWSFLFRSFHWSQMTIHNFFINWVTHLLPVRREQFDCTPIVVFLPIGWR